MGRIAKTRIELEVVRSNPDIFERIGVEVRNTTNGYVRDYAKAIQREAQRLAPVRTGHLKASIRATKVSDGTWKVEVGAHYGKFVEYGTRYQHAQPFLTPAVEIVKKSNRFRVGNVLRKFSR